MLNRKFVDGSRRYPSYFKLLHRHSPGEILIKIAEIRTQNSGIRWRNTNHL